MVDELGNGKPSNRVELQCVLPHPDCDARLQPDRHVASLRAAVRLHCDHGIRGFEVGIGLVESATSAKLIIPYRHSDAVGERFYHITVPIFIGVIGFVIAICTMNTGARYFSL